MATLSLTDVTTGTTISSTTHNANNTLIEDFVNDFDGANIQAGTVALSALATLTAAFSVEGQSLATGSSTFYIPIAVVASENWTATKGAYWIEDSGTGNGSVTIRHGTLSGGTFSSAGTLVSAGTVAFDTDGADAAGTLTASGAVTSSSTVLEVAFTAGTGQNDTSNKLFKVSLLFTRSVT